MLGFGLRLPKPNLGYFSRYHLRKAVPKTAVPKTAVNRPIIEFGGQVFLLATFLGTAFQALSGT